MTTIKQFEPVKRKALKALILTTIENRKKQKAIFERTLIKMLKDQIDLGNSVLKGTEHIEVYQRRSGKITKWMTDFLVKVSSDNDEEPKSDLPYDKLNHTESD